MIILVDYGDITVYNSIDEALTDIEVTVHPPPFGENILKILQN